MHLSALLDEGLGDERAELQVELGRKEPYALCCNGWDFQPGDRQARQAERGNPASEPQAGQGLEPASRTAQLVVPSMPGMGWELWGAVLSSRRHKYGQAGQAFLHPEKFLLPEAPVKLT